LSPAEIAESARRALQPRAPPGILPTDRVTCTAKRSGFGTNRRMAVAVEWARMSDARAGSMDRAAAGGWKNVCCDERAEPAAVKEAFRGDVGPANRAGHRSGMNSSSSRIAPLRAFPLAPQVATLGLAHDAIEAHGVRRKKASHRSVT